MPKITEEDKKKIIELIESGKSIRQVAAEVGCAHTTVRRLIKDLESSTESSTKSSTEDTPKSYQSYQSEQPSPDPFGGFRPETLEEKVDKLATRLETITERMGPPQTPGIPQTPEELQTTEWRPRRVYDPNLKNYFDDTNLGKDWVPDPPPVLQTLDGTEFTQSARDFLTEEEIAEANPNLAYRHENGRYFFAHELYSYDKLKVKFRGLPIYYLIEGNRKQR